MGFKLFYNAHFIDDVNQMLAIFVYSSSVSVKIIKNAVIDDKQQFHKKRLLVSVVWLR